MLDEWINWFVAEWTLLVIAAILEVVAFLRCTQHYLAWNRIRDFVKARPGRALGAPWRRCDGPEENHYSARR